jgi:formylglycine-generating enzyme required for sulfatase activity
MHTRKSPTTDAADWFELIDVRGGTFDMGSSRAEIDRAARAWTHRLVDASYTPAMFASWLEKEHPAHRVRVSPFRLARFPVTNRQYRAFCQATSHRPARSLVLGLPGDHPVWGVDGASIAAFLAWARQATGVSVRLPTEAEWEWAARGPEHREYPFGDEFDPRLCNTREAGVGTTTAVGAHADHPSPFGVCDMAGNVEEWTASDYREYPGGRFVHDHLTDALGTTYPVLRGGSAELGGDLARCARRHGPHPKFTMFGFRVAVSTLSLA